MVARGGDADLEEVGTAQHEARGVVAARRSAEHADAADVHVGVLGGHLADQRDVIVQPHFAEVLVGGQAEGLTAPRGAGAVDHHDNRADLRDAVAGHAQRHAPGGGHLGGGRAGVNHFYIAQFFRGGVAFFFVDVEQRDLAAVRDDMLRDRVAEPGRTAGDDGLGLGELHAGASCLENPRL